MDARFNSIIHACTRSLMLRACPCGEAAARHPIIRPYPLSLLVRKSSRTRNTRKSLPPPLVLRPAFAYCVAAKNFLTSKGQQWEEVRIDLDPAERDKMVALARRTSVPQIFIGDVHVGGYDDMMALHRAGKLEPLLAGQALEARA